VAVAVMIVVRTVIVSGAPVLDAPGVGIVLVLFVVALDQLARGESGAGSTLRPRDFYRRTSARRAA
jgi:hypothetical protein